jgi:hypothetical protein
VSRRYCGTKHFFYKYAAYYLQNRATSENIPYRVEFVSDQDFLARAYSELKRFPGISLLPVVADDSGRIVE